MFGQSLPNDCGDTVCRGTPSHFKLHRAEEAVVSAESDVSFELAAQNLWFESYLLKRQEWNERKQPLIFWYVSVLHGRDNFLCAFLRECCAASVTESGHNLWTGRENNAGSFLSPALRRCYLPAQNI